MYAVLLTAHSLMRWLVLIFLLYAICRGFAGYYGRKSFTRTDNSIRHLTATMAHIQLMTGMILYFKSPLVQAFWKSRPGQEFGTDYRFFSLIHIALMFAAVVLITVGSAMAKRRTDDRRKFRTMLVWFIFALLIILIAIPWPFSPLAKRPLIRL